MDASEHRRTFPGHASKASLINRKSLWLIRKELILGGEIRLKGLGLWCPAN